MEKCETENLIKKWSALPSIKRTHFQLTLARASAVHKVPSLSLEQDVTDFDLEKQISFGPGQIYNALGRVKTFDKVYCVGEFSFAIKVNKDALLEYEHLKQNNLFSPIKRNAISGDAVTI